VRQRTRSWVEGNGCASGQGTSAHAYVDERTDSASAHGTADGEITVVGARLVLDPAGALYWPEERALVLADLHLEKGSSFAARGMLLPPYDTAATLAGLGQLIARYAPRLVIALGDSFHDGAGPARVAPEDRRALLALQCGRDWLWIAGNHDPEPAHGIGGSFASLLALGGLTFRHEPALPECGGEIAGHLHPMARIHVRGASLSRRCFVRDSRRVVMPAFGAYTGGLNVRARAFAGLFDATFMAHVLGRHRLYAFAASRCLPD
jgi:DNA ligase-associated metallophosphoesterase